MDLREQLLQVAQAKLTSPHHFLVDVVISRHKPMKITIILDGDQGITIDDCSKMSRTISTEIEEQNWMAEENYTLEVGTPGLDHPLKLKRQYKKNVGREINVTLINKSKQQGTLIAADEDKISLSVAAKEGKKSELKTIEIPFTEIEKALVMVSFKK